jgi:hypothetical protein
MGVVVVAVTTVSASVVVADTSTRDFRHEADTDTMADTSLRDFRPALSNTICVSCPGQSHHLF